MIQEATLPQSQQIQQQQQQQQHQQHHQHPHQHRQPPKRKRIKSSQSSNDDANTSGSQCYLGVASGWQNVDQNVRELAPSSQSSSTAASAPASTTTATSSACFDGGSRFSNGFQISNDIVSSTAHHSSMDNMDNNGMNDIDEDISTMQPRNRPGLITTTATPTINPAIIDDDNDGDIFDSAMMTSYHPIGLPPLSYQQSIIMNQMDMVANASSVDVVNNFGINHRLNHNNNSNNNNHNNHDHNQHHICPHQQQPLIPPTIATDTLPATGSTVSITNVSATPSSLSSSSTSLDNLSQSLTVDNHSLQNHHHHQNSFHQNHQHSSMRPQQQQFYSNAHNRVGGGGGDGALVSNGSEASSTSVSNIEKLCFGCRQTLSTSPIIATVSGYHNWHIHCLCCSECGQSLSQSRSCYGRNGRIYCKDDYIKSIKCCKCNRSISSTDWVRRAGTLVYHLACFACDICQRQLSTGEKFTIENLSNNNTIGYQHHSTNNRSNCKNDVRHSMIANANSAPSIGLANSNQNNYHHHHHHHGHKNNSAYNSGGNYRLVCKLHFGIKDEDVPESTVVAQSGSRALDLDQVPSIENGRLANETHGHRIHPDDSLMIETGGSVDGNSGPEGNPFSTNPSNNNVPGVTTIDQSAVANQNSNLSNCGRNSSLSNSTTGTSTVQSATTPPSTTNSSCGGGGGSSGVGAGSGVGIGGNSKTKRVRTTFTEEQLSILQANFQIDSNPDGQDLERIAALTGLSKRVTQVWFQNSRARQKKFMSKSSTSSSATHHHHHHHHHHQPQSQPQRHQLMDDGSHSQAPISLLINGQQPPLNRGTNSGCGVALWSPGTTTSNSSSSSNGIGSSSGNNGMQDNQPTPSESVMLLDSHTNPHHSHHQHHRHHQMVVKNMAWNNPGSSSSSTMASMNETSKLNSTNETSELPSMTSNGNSSNNDGSIVGSI